MKVKTPMVSKSELLEELKRELNYHENGGTKYRQDTTRWAMKVAQNDFVEPEKLVQRNSAHELVKLSLNLHDEERVNDVSKMLSVVTRDLLNKKMLPDDVVEFAKRKMDGFTGLKFM